MRVICNIRREEKENAHHNNVELKVACHSLGPATGFTESQ
jgi:hypothetical protein